MFGGDSSRIFKASASTPLATQTGASMPRSYCRPVITILG